MVLKIECPCGCSINISSNFRNKSDIVCPNCGKPLPLGATEEIRELIKHYSSLAKIIANSEPCYELEIL